VIFWKTCPDQIGAALVGNLMFKSMAHKAELSEELQMADELLENARFDSVIIGLVMLQKAVKVIR